VKRLAAAVLVGLCACAPSLRYRMPASLHSYRILVPVRDSLNEALAQALHQHGVRVERRVRGGSAPAAALIHFTYRDQQGGVSWMLVRLADTRTGVIVGETALRLDSLPPSGARQAEAILDSLGFTRRPTP
jgi:hypothetical protein